MKKYGFAAILLMFLLGFAACDSGTGKPLSSLNQPVLVEIERFVANATNSYLVLTATDVSVEHKGVTVKCPCYLGDYHHFASQRVHMMVAVIASGDITIGLDPDGAYTVSVTRENIYQQYYFVPSVKP